MRDIEMLCCLCDDRTQCCMVEVLEVLLVSCGLVCIAVGFLE